MFCLHLPHKSSSAALTPFPAILPCASVTPSFEHKLPPSSPKAPAQSYGAARRPPLFLAPQQQASMLPLLCHNSLHDEHAFLALDLVRRHEVAPSPLVMDPPRRAAPLPAVFPPPPAAGLPRARTRSSSSGYCRPCSRWPWRASWQMPSRVVPIPKLIPALSPAPSSPPQSLPSLPLLNRISHCAPVRR